MFLDDDGIPRDLTSDNLYDYSFDLHGTMLLTSADTEVYMPPKWHGTMYGTEEMLNSYRQNFNPNPSLLNFHALQPYEPELVCCKKVVVELTVLPAGQSLFSDAEIAVFVVKLTKYVTNADGSEEVDTNTNTLITKEIGTELCFFPHNHPYHVRIMREGIDVVYVDDRIYKNGMPSVTYQHQRICNLLSNLQPRCVKSLSGRPLPPVLNSVCRDPDDGPI
ncbi:GL15656 [Drosophila persimilis]|uniref:GL15656 n=1 Tax=Drosophila persimilis TaxID=7234 RepID=B4GQ27_DROPE|nr:uncharacterized protein LOC6595680 [Drosophila persimilis]EDW39699.1 GL15656 [Drosophila persimilis]